MDFNLGSRGWDVPEKENRNLALVDEGGENDSFRAQNYLPIINYFTLAQFLESFPIKRTKAARDEACHIGDTNT